MELQLNIDYNFDHQMSLSKSKCWYSNNCLHFLKCVVPLSSYNSDQLHSKDGTTLAPKLADPPFCWKSSSSPFKSGSSLPDPDGLIFCTI